MDAIDIILTPFTYIYRGIKFLFMLPYHFVLAMKKLFVKERPKQEVKTNNNQKIINEAKQNNEIKVVSGVRSAYSTPNKPKPETDPVKLNAINNEKTLKRQKEFEKLVQKARQEEAKRAQEQEKVKLEIQKKENERNKRELEVQKKQQQIELENEKKDEKLREKGEPVTFSEKLKAFYKKLTYNPKQDLEYKAKKAVLEEQFKNNDKNSSRFDKPIVFSYIAKNANGEIEKSSIEAYSRVDVYSFLLAEGYEVYEITVAKTNFNINIGSFKFKRSRLIFYLSQLSAYLKSGIALADAVKILDSQAPNLNEKKAWRAVYYDLSMGDNLSAALEKRKDTFPRLLINMVKTAEMTGNLIETLDDMVVYYTEAESTSKQMKSAMTYPIVVSLFAIVVIVFILIWVVPQFVGIYSDLGSRPPMITLIVIAISEFLKNYIIYILLAVVVLILIYIYLFRNVLTFKKAMQEFYMRLPVFGNIIIYNEVTMFTKTFANLLNHNVFITDSMDVLRKITDNEVYKKLIRDTANNLTKGNPISLAFKNQWAFPNIAYQMLLTGEKTGRLGPMMEKVAEYYQEQHRTIINQMKSLIEPVLIVTLAVIVGGILLAVIIPMYGMYEAL